MKKIIVNCNDKSIEKARVVFWPSAFCKMCELVMTNHLEVGWRFTVLSNDPGIYEITDVLVYPQTVTGCTVETDEKELGKWESELDDVVFNAMRGHGHSHVNMGVSPSSTDLDHQEKIFDMLKDQDFYIFLIVNKKLEMHWDIYDMRDRLHYETEDVVLDKVYKENDTSLIKINKEKTYYFGGEKQPQRVIRAFIGPNFEGVDD